MRQQPAGHDSPARSSPHDTVGTARRHKDIVPRKVRQQADDHREPLDVVTGSGWGTDSEWGEDAGNAKGSPVDGRGVGESDSFGHSARRGRTIVWSPAGFETRSLVVCSVAFDLHPDSPFPAASIGAGMISPCGDDFDDADACVARMRSEGSNDANGPSPVDLPRIQRAVREILAAVGEDPDRDGLRDTPARVARMYAELFRGLTLQPGRHLKRVFEERYDELVLVRDITFNSMCEHHLLPFMGVAHVGYLPNGRVAGLSKLARVVEEVALRPQVQERMTHQVADLLESELDAKGVVVVVEAAHTCMTIRGVRKPGSLTTTSAVRGLFKTNASSRAEAMALINRRA